MSYKIQAVELIATGYASISLQIATINRLRLAGLLDTQDINAILDDALLNLEAQRGASPADLHPAYDIARAIVSCALPDPVQK